MHPPMDCETSRSKKCKLDLIHFLILQWSICHKIKLVFARLQIGVDKFCRASKQMRIIIDHEHPKPVSSI